MKPSKMSKRTKKRIMIVVSALMLLLAVKACWVKCARIRGAFVGQFDDHMARHYYIDGLRGEAKKIALPRDLVVWE